MMENGEKVAKVDKHGMTGEQLEHIIRDGGRQVGAAADERWSRGAAR